MPKNAYFLEKAKAITSGVLLQTPFSLRQLGLCLQTPRCYIRLLIQLFRVRF